MGLLAWFVLVVIGGLACLIVIGGSIVSHSENE